MMRSNPPKPPIDRIRKNAWITDPPSPLECCGGSTGVDYDRHEREGDSDSADRTGLGALGGGRGSTSDSGVALRRRCLPAPRLASSTSRLVQGQFRERKPAWASLSR